MPFITVEVDASLIPLPETLMEIPPMKPTLLLIACLAALLPGCRNTLPVVPPLSSAALRPALPNPEQSYFGLNGTKVFHIPGEMHTTVETRIAWMKEAGVAWDRADWWWHVIEPEQGRFDFSVPDRVADFMEDRGIQIYPILCYGASWWKDRTAPLSDEDFEHFASYVFQTMSHYKGRFPFWSVWNEPNIPDFWKPAPKVEDYARLLQKTREAARRADPEALLCAPVIAPLGSWDKKFTVSLYQMGAADWFDIFDYHYYRSYAPEAEVPAELADIRAVMCRFGDGKKPVWISETGVAGPVADQPESYLKQAAFVVRNHLLCLACGVERIFYFDLQNWNDDTGGSWDSKLGLVETGGKKKPAFYAYKTMIREVDFRHVIGRVRCPSRDVEGVLVYDGETGSYSLALWLAGDDDRQTTFTANLRGLSAALIQPMGDETPLTIPDYVNDDNPWSAEILLDRHPRFIHGVDPFVYLPEAGISLTADKVYLNPGETVSVSVKSHPILNQARIRVLSHHASPGLAWNPDTGELSADADLPGGRLDLHVTLECTFPGAASVVRMVSCVVEVLPSLDLTLRPFLDPDGTMRVSTAVANQSPRAMEGALRLAASGDPAPLATSPRLPLKAGELSRGEFTPDISRLNGLSQTAEWTLSFREFTGRPFRIHPVLLARTAPDIDGDLTEWKEIPPMLLNSRQQMVRGPESWTPGDASASVRLMLDTDYIYLAAYISDDDPMINPHPPNMIWKGDSLELYMGFAGPSKRTVLDKNVEFQIGIAPTCSLERPIVFLYHKDILLDDARVAARKTPKGYAIEAAIPLSCLGNPVISNGMLLALDAALDDLDHDDWAPAGNEPGCSLMWNGTGMNWIDPSNWGMGVIHPGL